MYYLITLADGPYGVYHHKNVKNRKGGVCTIMKNNQSNTGQILAQNLSRKILDSISFNLNRHCPRILLEPVKVPTSENISSCDTSSHSESEAYAGDISDTTPTREDKRRKSRRLVRLQNDNAESKQYRGSRKNSEEIERKLQKNVLRVSNQSINMEKTSIVLLSTHMSEESIPQSNHNVRKTLFKNSKQSNSQAEENGAYLHDKNAQQADIPSSQAEKDMSQEFSGLTLSIIEQNYNEITGTIAIVRESETNDSEENGKVLEAFRKRNTINDKRENSEDLHVGVNEKNGCSLSCSVNILESEIEVSKNADLKKLTDEARRDTMRGELSEVIEIKTHQRQEKIRRAVSLILEEEHDDSRTSNAGSGKTEGKYNVDEKNEHSQNLHQVPGDDESSDSENISRPELEIPKKIQSEATPVAEFSTVLSPTKSSSQLNDSGEVITEQSDCSIGVNEERTSLIPTGSKLDLENNSPSDLSQEHGAEIDQHSHKMQSSLTLTDKDRAECRAIEVVETFTPAIDTNNNNSENECSKSLGGTYEFIDTSKSAELCYAQIPDYTECKINGNICTVPENGDGKDTQNVQISQSLCDKADSDIPPVTIIDSKDRSNAEEGEGRKRNKNTYSPLPLSEISERTILNLSKLEIQKYSHVNSDKLPIENSSMMGMVELSEFCTSGRGDNAQQDSQSLFQVVNERYSTVAPRLSVLAAHEEYKLRDSKSTHDELSQGENTKPMYPSELSKDFESELIIPGNNEYYNDEISDKVTPQNSAPGMSVPIQEVHENSSFDNLASDCIGLIYIPYDEAIIEVNSESSQIEDKGPEIGSKIAQEVLEDSATLSETGMKIDYNGDNLNDMDIDNIENSRADAPLDLSFANNHMDVDVKKISNIRIVSSKILQTPFSYKKIPKSQIELKGTTFIEQSGHLTKNDSFIGAALDDSPYIQDVNHRLSDDITTNGDEEIGEQESTPSVLKSNHSIKLKNVVRALNFDSDEVDSDNDPDYVPPSSEESEPADPDEAATKSPSNSHGANLSKDESIEISPSVNQPGIIVCRPQNLYVEPSRGRAGDKKEHFCPYCLTKIKDKFARHLERRHKEEKDVQRFISESKKSKNRLAIINSIRGKGDYMYNTNPDYNQGDLIVSRRPNDKTGQSRTAEDHLPCGKCRRWFAKSTLRHHFRVCANRKSKNERSAMLMSRKLLCHIHEKACLRLKKDIFPPIREDEVKDIIRYDELIIIYGNKLCKTYRDEHHDKGIRSSLRLCGRLLLNLKTISKEITDFASLYDPKHYDDVMLAINLTGRLDEVKNLYGAPSTASDCGTLLKKLAALRRSYCIKGHLPEEKQACEDFLHLLNEDLPASVSKTVEETQAAMKREKVIILPSADDIQKLYYYLQKQRETNLAELQAQISYKNWVALAEVTLTSVQVFNRKRVGDVERIRITEFQTAQSIQDYDEDLFNTLSKVGQKISRHYTRFITRGKLGRIIPVLLTSKLQECIKILVETRSAVGISESNPYIFGLRHGADKDRNRWLDACVLMRRFSSECGASKPETLRGTELRKHIATQCVMLNLNSDEVAALAHYMGHEEDIHKKHYRQPIVAHEILKISQLLERACKKTDMKGNIIDELSEDDDVDEGSAESQQHDQRVVSPILQDTECTREDPPSRSDPSNNDEGTRKKKREVVPERKATSLDSSSPKMRKKYKRLEVNDQDSESEDDHRSTSTGIRARPQKRGIFQSDEKRNSSGGEKKKKRRSTPPYGPVKRTRWTQEEVDIATRLYSKYFQLKRLPKVRDIEQDIQNNPGLRGRTALKIKTWINNVQKKHERK